MTFTLKIAVSPGSRIVEINSRVTAALGPLLLMRPEIGIAVGLVVGTLGRAKIPRIHLLSSLGYQLLRPS